MSSITERIKSLRIYVQSHIRGNRMGDGLVFFVKALGINDLLTRILYAEDRKNPTKAMKNTEKYFTEHKEEVSSVSALLADDFSRDVYLSIIKYRHTHHPKDCPKFTKKNQYFVKELFSLSDSEVFVDCGAYDGDTLNAFQKATGGRYQSVVCFEPVEQYYTRLKKRAVGKPVTAIRAGVYKTTTTLHFNDADGKGSSITSASEHTISIPVCAIDDVEECKDATFIKMDIEGSEFDALKGARQTILRNKPILAICIYHRNRDFIELPKWIHSLVPEYQLYIRHHSFSLNETVLYAVPPQRTVN